MVSTTDNACAASNESGAAGIIMVCADARRQHAGMAFWRVASGVASSNVVEGRHNTPRRTKA